MWEDPKEARPHERQERVGRGTETKAETNPSRLVGPAPHSRGRMSGVTRISDEELAKAMAENVDVEGNDVGLEAWVASWTPEQRAKSAENVRRWVADARHALGGDPGGPSSD